MNPVHKGGRCFNASHKDSGRIIHLIDDDEPDGFWGDKALCGAEPGYKGYGWVKSDKEANCPKCLKKFNKIKK